MARSAATTTGCGKQLVWQTNHGQRSRVTAEIQPASNTNTKEKTVSNTKNTTKTINTCECLTITSESDTTIAAGTCGQQTARRFCPGHDARTKSTLQKVYRSGRQLQIGGTAVDVAAVARSYGYERYLTDAPKRKSRARTNVEQKPETRVLQKGRWTYPLLMVGEEIYGMCTVAYEARDGSMRTEVVKISQVCDPT